MNQRENLVVIFNQPGLKDSDSWKLQLIRLVNAACSDLQQLQHLDAFHVPRLKFSVRQN